MSIKDYTQLTKDHELPPREQPLFTKVKRDDILPGLIVAVYESKDCTDVYYATREACLIVGYSANWLSTALSRESTSKELQRLGMELPLPIITVKVGRLKRQMKALSRSDFKVMVEYANEAGNKDAIALYGMFQIIGLHKLAGIPSDAKQIGQIYSRFKEDQPAH